MLDRQLNLRFRLVCLVASLSCAGLWCAAASAAEIRLRAKCEMAGPLVRLGDVADVFAVEPAEKQALEQIELFPTPAAGTQAFLRIRELQDLLHQRGVNLAEHRVAGASLVAIRRAVEAPAAPVAAPSRVTSTMSRQAELLVQAAIAQYLNAQVGESRPWEILLQLELNDAQVRAVTQSAAAPRVSGGQSPWVGGQNFVLAAEADGAVVEVPVAAQITLPTQVAYVVRSLPRGTLVQAADVEMRAAPIATPERAVNACQSLEQLIGQETTRALGAGQVIETHHVRSPLLVRRGDAVTVYARSAGLRVRTTARASEDGGQGDLVLVESLTNKAKYYARVSGVQTVEVYARPITVESSPAARFAGPQQ